eukprot:321753-Pleurochrysis_carterae.AAC.2
MHVQLFVLLRVYARSTGPRVGYGKRQSAQIALSQCVRIQISAARTCGVVHLACQGAVRKCGRLRTARTCSA